MQGSPEREANLQGSPLGDGVLRRAPLGEGGVVNGERALLPVEFEHGHERLLRHFDAADFLEAFFALGLLLQQLPFSGHVAAVALGDDVLTQGPDGLPCNDPIADGSLDGDFE